MTTTGSTTSTTSGSSVLTTLGTGSGIDTASLVSSLVQAQFDVKNRQLTAKADALTTQISAVAKLKSGITGFDAALRTLAKSGSLSTQPTSSNAAIRASASPGATIAALSGTLRVDQLAAAQAATTNTPVARGAAFRTGSLSLQFGTDGAGGFTAGSTAAITIDITAADTTLDGIAAKINAAKAGVTASVVDDGSGARLTIKGATGAAQAFELTGTDSDPNATGMSLSGLSVGRNATGTTIGTTAADAVLTLDGATFQRSSNTVSDLIAGVKLELSGTGTTTLGSSTPTDALSQAVGNFVETYNQLQAIVRDDVNPVNGVLKTDTTVASMARSLGRLTTSVLNASAAPGAPRTLADLGVTTNRDGTLSLDQAKLDKILASQPGAIEKMFAYGSGRATDGVSGALGAIVAQVTSRTAGLDVSTTRYTKSRSDITDQQTKATDAADQMKTRLTAQFAKMDAIVAQYKSTQSFLKSQVDAWNNKGN